jgi:putative hydrolase of the HAD superfamily
MAYYREHAHEGSSPEALASLREHCAQLLSAELGREVTVEAMMSAIRFRAFADAEPALSELRSRGLRLVCVSNWDISLPGVLERCGLVLDGVVTSAESGSRKPDPEIFRIALELAGCEAGEAVHVGDTPEEDSDGARAAGIPHLLLDRSGGGAARRKPSRAAVEAPRISSLTEIVQHLPPQ